MQIQSEPQTLERIFTGISTRYAVPHYQRDYSWNHDQWTELWTDIITAFSSNQEYFLGSFVLNTENLTSQGFYEIVDGQQRLTTFTILFSVIRDVARHYESNPENQAYEVQSKNAVDNKTKVGRARTKASTLVVHLSEPDNYFLRLNDKDHPTFYSKIQLESDPLLARDERQIYKAESRLTKAKKFFTRKIIEDFLSDPRGFVKMERFVTFCMTKLFLLRIAVGSDNDAYLLFETLNDRGLDLSISDLVKNRLLLGCGLDENKKSRVLNKWKELIEKLNKSRFQPQDYLRFYWCAFHEKCTKKELYKLIRNELESSDGEVTLDQWLEVSEFFCEITDRTLRFPNTSLTLGTEQCHFAEMNNLGYSVYLPLFLNLRRNRPNLIHQIVGPASSYLFRVITVGNFSAGRAESLFDKAQDAATSGGSDEDVVAVFSRDPESTDLKFVERLRTQRFEDNKSARHFLSKYHLHAHGPGHPLNHDIHLEHVLPQKEDSWASFDTDSRAREDWVFSLGNMTLLEQALNKSIQAEDFDTKVVRYRQRQKQSDSGSAIPMTYKIAADFFEKGLGWDKTRIIGRCDELAAKAPSIWPLPGAQEAPTNQSKAILESDISASESEDGMI